LRGRDFFHVRKPGAAGKRWAIARQRRGADGKSTYTVIPESDLPELAAINRAFLAGIHDFDQAYAQVLDLRKRLYKREREADPKPLTHAENVALMERYWASEYVDRDIVDPGSMKRSLRRAVEAVGTLSLLTATRQDLWLALANLPAEKQRRAASRLNQLLRFAGRTDVRVRLKRPERPDVRYVTLAQLRELSPKLTQPARDLAWIAFATGLRAGEIFGLRPESVRMEGREVYVESQIVPSGQRRPTKTREPRSTLVVPAGLPALERWLARPEAERHALRNERYSKEIRDAARRLWPHEPRRHVTLHGLRHSFAIHLLSKDIAIKRVAELLGNSVVVCERYYAGFKTADDDLAALAKRLAKA